MRAVVKEIDDKTHVIAQGQENTARADLSFIEKAMFAKHLEDMGYERDVITSALASNAAAVSKMVSVVTRIPSSVIGKVGAAAGVGRDRWDELSQLVGKKPDVVNEILSEPEFASCKATTALSGCSRPSMPRDRPSQGRSKARTSRGRLGTNQLALPSNVPARRPRSP